MSILVSFVISGEPDLRGYLAIDTEVNGHSHGGLRMAPDISAESIAQAARVMTLKYGFVGLPVGGAKSGIVADPEMPQDQKREVMRRFGQALGPFIKTNCYIPCEDLGTSLEDLRYMLDSMRLKVQHRSLTWKLSGFYTGLTVFSGAVAAARHIGLDLNRASVAIEGFGSVGGSVAQAFWERGYRVVAISTSHGAIYDEAGLDVGELINLRDRVGSQVVNLYDKGERIDKSRLVELGTDIFSPCAQSYSITMDNAGRVAAKIVCPGANVPFAPGAEAILFRRDVLYVPDFAANCGGVLGISMRRAGLKDDYIRRFLEQKVGGQISKIFEAAAKENVTPAAYAERIAKQKFLRAKAAAEKRSVTGRVFNFGLELYRKGIIPYQVVTPVASRYFENRF